MMNEKEAQDLNKNIRGPLSLEFIYNLGSLIFSIFFIHFIYLLSIRPKAQALMAIAEQNNETAPRSFVIILKDYEQEFCLILMLWAIFMIGSKIYAIIRQNYIIDVDILGFGDSGKVSKKEAMNALSNLKRYKFGLGDSVVIQTLSTSIQRYITTSNIQNASDTVAAAADNIGMRLEADLSMIRYIVWAIPSIGFIGTVRGIGQALSQADIALTGDIAGMTNSLGIAFNSTFVALLISIFLMFLLHQIQQMNDKLILDAQDYCDRVFISKILG